MKRLPRVMFRAGLGFGLLAAFSSGCATGGRGGGAVAEVHLFGVPVALNLDGVPGPDAIGVRIYASGAGAARGVVIRRGVLEVLMFDGAVPAREVQSTPPRKVWSFGAGALKPLVAETSLGSGYQLALSWETAQPRGPVVTVAARYRGADGKELWSAANTISMTLK